MGRRRLAAVAAHVAPASSAMGKAAQRTQEVLSTLQRPVAPRFADRVAFVTGGGSGIGAAACRRIAAEGGAVAVADKRLATAQEVADEIERAGGRALALECDVSVEAEVERAVEGGGGV